MFDIWHLGVPIENLNRSLEFYVDGLGFDFLGYYGENLAFISPPGKRFTIELMELKGADSDDLMKKPHHLAFECENVEEFRQTVLNKKFFKHVEAIKPSNSGLRLFSLTDPDGIAVQFYQGRAGFHEAIRETASAYQAQALKKEMKSKIQNLPPTE